VLYGTKKKNICYGKEGVVVGFSNSVQMPKISPPKSILERVSKPDFQAELITFPYNSKTFLDASINKVIYTLIEAFLLVS
jgi:HAE1 family hydrophobic/amphiphilic exporter-1